MSSRRCSGCPQVNVGSRSNLKLHFRYLTDLIDNLTPDYRANWTFWKKWVSWELACRSTQLGPIAFPRWSAELGVTGSAIVTYHGETGLSHFYLVQLGQPQRWPLQVRAEAHGWCGESMPCFLGCVCPDTCKGDQRAGEPGLIIDSHACQGDQTDLVHMIGDGWWHASNSNSLPISVVSNLPCHLVLSLVFSHMSSILHLLFPRREPHGLEGIHILEKVSSWWLKCRGTQLDLRLTGGQFSHRS